MAHSDSDSIDINIHELLVSVNTLQHSTDLNETRGRDKYTFSTHQISVHMV